VRQQHLPQLIALTPILVVFGFTAVPILVLVMMFPDQGSSSRNRARERDEYNARNGMATETTAREAEEFRKKQEANSHPHRKAILGQ
jgi:hypothetical protein